METTGTPRRKDLHPATFRNELANLKFALLAYGARVSKEANDAVAKSKMPLRTRSGVSGGLDIKLAESVDVNVPVNEAFVSNSPLIVTADEQMNLQVVDERTGTRNHVELLPIPNFYSLTTLSGEPMRRVAQMCSRDRICYGMTGPTCRFWRKDLRCQYCSIGKNYKDDGARKKIDTLMEVLEVSLQGGSTRPRHILVGGGTPNGDDMGSILASEITKRIKKHFDLSVYVMIAAPLENSEITRVYDAGADDLGMNLEFWSDEAWRRFIPGKNSLIGKTRYLQALEYAQSLFGPTRTRSILVAGVEGAHETLAGVRFLTQIGVLPILSPFRALDGTLMADFSGFSAEQYFDLWAQAERIAAEAGAILGPDCLACQNNTLALPLDT